MSLLMQIARASCRVCWMRQLHLQNGSLSAAAAAAAQVCYNTIELLYTASAVFNFASYLVISLELFWTYSSCVWLMLTVK